MQQFQWDKTLIMVLRHDGVELSHGGLTKYRIGWQRSRNHARYGFGLQDGAGPQNRRRDQTLLLVPKTSRFARMRVEPRHRDPGAPASEAVHQGPADQDGSPNDFL